MTRFASGHYLSRVDTSVPLGAEYPFTICCWVKCDDDTVANWQPIWSFGNGSSGQDDETFYLRLNKHASASRAANIQFHFDTGTTAIWMNTSDFADIKTDWLFIAVVRSASNSTVVYYRTRSASSLSSISSSSSSASFTPDTFRIGGYSNVTYGQLAGHICSLKIYNQALSAEEIQRESFCHQPWRTKDLVAFYPLHHQTTFRDLDWRGGYAMTATGASWSSQTANFPGVSLRRGSVGEGIDEISEGFILSLDGSAAGVGVSSLEKEAIRLRLSSGSSPGASSAGGSMVRWRLLTGSVPGVANVVPLDPGPGGGTRIRELHGTGTGAGSSAAALKRLRLSSASSGGASASSATARRIREADGGSTGASSSTASSRRLRLGSASSTGTSTAASSSFARSRLLRAVAVGVGSSTLNKLTGLLHLAGTAAGISTASALLHRITSEVTERMLQLVRIQNALVQAAKDGRYHPLSFNSKTGILTVNESLRLKPSVAICNEIQSDFGPARLNRRKFTRERLEWIWMLELAFSQPATVEPFEQTLAEDPLVIPHDVVSGLRSVTLEILKTSCEHPPQQQPANGSRFFITFKANVTPS